MESIFSFITFVLIVSPGELDMPRVSPPLPLPVKRALKQLGRDIHDARRRRRISTVVMADRMQVSRPTLRRVEQGDANVGIASYANALYVLGMIERLGDLASIANDPIGQRFASDDLPKRIR